MLRRAGRSAFLVLFAFLWVVSAPRLSPGENVDRGVRFWHPNTQPQRAKERQTAADEFEGAIPGLEVEVEKAVAQAQEEFEADLARMKARRWARFRH